jgi:DNA helicase HerA-like ATPase
VRPFDRLPIERAASAAVDRWLTAVRPARAALDVGELVVEPTVRFLLDAGGFDRHTFFCGQSGSGKTFALGAVLEQLLLQTKLRLVVLDPNSDFVRLNALREGLDDTIASRYREAAAGIAVRRAGPNGPERLHVRFTDCDAEEQGAILRLDPIRDSGEYGALVDLLEGGFEDTTEGAGELAERMLATSNPDVQALGARVRNLGIHHWQVWSTGDAGSVQDLVGPGGPRGLVIDLGSAETPGEKAVAAESVLAALWRRREVRHPTLVVIDEAHNVCPRDPADPVTALATEHAARFAAEGRKFGLYLLVSTQRPQRVNELVMSQCDNLVLMRMASAADLAYVSARLSYAPAPLLARATAFGLGEALVAGKIASHPAFVRFGPRIAEEGGGDVPTTWAGGGGS